MRINGLNVKKDFDVKLDIRNSWKEGFFESNSFSLFGNGMWDLVKENRQLAEKICEVILNAYETAVNFDGKIEKLKTDANGIVILSKGCLVHLSPAFDKTGKPDQEKFLSIKEFGFLSLAAILGREGYEWDQEVPLQVSFHNVNETMSVRDFLSTLISLSKEKNPIYKNLKEISDLAFVVDTNNDGMAKLLAFNKQDPKLREESFKKRDFYKTEKGTEYAYKFSKYPKNISTEIEKQALGALDAGSMPADSVEVASFLPVGVPSKYIVGIILPKKLENNTGFKKFLSKTFENATLISQNGKDLSKPEITK